MVGDTAVADPGIDGTTVMELIQRSACDLVTALLAGEVSPLELLDALEARITAVDSSVNALPILCFDRARDEARRIQDLPPDQRGVLAGLPVPRQVPMPLS